MTIQKVPAALLDTGAAAGNLAAGSVTATMLASDAVTTVKILNANVTAAKLATDAVETAKIKDDAVTTAKILNANVTPAKLSQPITLGTVTATTSGANIDVTGIPAWAKRVTVLFNGVSTNGTNYWMLQLGTSGGVEATNYLAAGGTIVNVNFPVIANVTNGFIINSGAAANVLHGSLTIHVIDPANYVYAVSGMLGASNTTGVFIVSGSKTLAGVLDRIRLTTDGGTDAFDAGAINILYE